MVNLVDLLHLGSHSAAPQQDASPEVITVQGKPKSYDNTSTVNRLDQSTSAPDANGRYVNEGIWGLLPQSWRHGRVRDALGALRDAYLVNKGLKPSYENSGYQRAQVADAMAGFEKDPQAAAERLGHLGLAGTAGLAGDIADFGQKRDQIRNAEDLKNQQQQSLNDYRSSQVQDRTERRDLALRPQIGGMLAAAARTGDPALFAKARERALGLRGASSTITDQEIPATVEEAQMMYGMTAPQVASDITKNRSIDERATAANLSHQDRQASIGVSRSRAARGNNPTAAVIMQGLLNKQNRGETLTGAEQQVWDKYTKSGGQSKASRPLLTVGGGGQSSAAKSYKGKPVFSSTSDPAFQRLPKGSPFYVDGDPNTIRYKK